MDDIVELVKQRNPIEDVIQDTFPLQRQHGRYLRAKEHDSLVVDTGRQMYVWNSQGESGDVIDWLCKRGNLDFKSAVEQLCRRANLPEPRWGREETENRNAQAEPGRRLPDRSGPDGEVAVERRGRAGVLQSQGLDRRDDQNE